MAPLSIFFVAFLLHWPGVFSMLTALIHYIHTCIPSFKRQYFFHDRLQQPNEQLPYVLNFYCKKATISDCKCHVSMPKYSYFRRKRRIYTHVFLVDITTLIHQPAAKLPYYYPVLLLLLILRYAYIVQTFFDHEEARKHCFKKELRPLMMNLYSLLYFLPIQCQLNPSADVHDIRCQIKTAHSKPFFTLFISVT